MASKEEILNKFAQERKSTYSMLEKQNMFTKIDIALPTEQKASDLKKRPKSECLPILIKQMSIGETHVGRYFHGKLVSLPFIVSSVYSYLEDDLGEMIRVRFPNPLSNMNLSFKQMASHIDDIFPVGKRVVIYEPFYKLFNDGSAGIRIEEMDEFDFVIENEKESEDNFMKVNLKLLINNKNENLLTFNIHFFKWKNVGNSLFQKHKEQDALDYYKLSLCRLGAQFTDLSTVYKIFACLIRQWAIIKVHFSSQSLPFHSTILIVKHSITDQLV
jgi:hypothetical protein